jgi:hypothetical protein
VPFGEVRSGTLTVRGYFHKASLIPCQNKWDFNSLKCRYDKARWRCHAADPNTGRSFGGVALDSFKTYNKLSLGFEDATPDRAISKYYYREDRHYYECRSCTNYENIGVRPETLWYMSKSQFVREKYGHRQLVALILTPCDDGNRTYRRFGLLFVGDEGASKNWMTPEEVQKCFQTIQLV